MKYSFLSLQSATVNELCSFYGNKRCGAYVDHEGLGMAEIQDLICLKFDGFDYLQADYTRQVDIRIDTPEDTLVFYLPLRGNMEIGQKHGRIVTGTGPTAVAARDCRVVRFTPQRRHIRIALARRNLMARLHSIRSVANHAPLAFHQSPGANHLPRVLGSLVLTSFAAVSGSNGASEERLSALGGIIESAVLYLWPNNYIDNIRSQSHAILPRQVKRAMDLIAADPFRPLAIVDIARECGVSIRTLQHGFRTFASCTPREFVLRERMQHLERCGRDQADLGKLKARVGWDLLRSLNRQHEKMHGRLLVEWFHLTPGAGE